MNYSKDIKRFINSLIFNYAKFDKLEKSYEIDVDYIPEIDIQDLVARMMLENPSSAQEATSIDNPAYSKSMLPALTRYLQSQTRDDEIEFNHEWRNGVTSYFYPEIENLLQDAISEYNMERKQCA